MTPQELQELQARNEARVKQKIAEMGTKWILHPLHSPKKINQPSSQQQKRYESQ